jgi:cytochrome c551/c552
MRPTLLLLSVCLLAGPVVARAEAFDERLAMRTLKQNKCLNCHSVTRDKDGPSYQAVAQKYKEHPDPRQALFTHLTTSPTIKVKGKEEAHTSFKTDDAAEIMNVVDWILSN